MDIIVDAVEKKKIDFPPIPVLQVFEQENVDPYFELRSLYRVY